MLAFTIMFNKELLITLCINKFSLTKEHLKFDWCFDNMSTLADVYICIKISYIVKRRER